jgi:hypothetical protein
MITPKQKAKELVFRFFYIDSDSKLLDDFTMTVFYAKRCALIAVEEIIEATKKYVAVVESVPYSKTGVDFVVNTEYDNFWLEVKIEIEKL